MGEAVTAFSIAVRSPDERIASQAQFKLGEAYLEGENRELALIQFSKVVYLYPHYSDMLEEALLKLGTLYMAEKKIPEARQATVNCWRRERGRIEKRLLEKCSTRWRRGISVDRKTIHKKQEATYSSHRPFLYPHWVFVLDRHL